MPDTPNTIRVTPIRVEPAARDATYVHNPHRSYVGTGGAPLNLLHTEPEFRGYIIFVNGYISDKFDNAGSTTWNAVMGKSPERDEGFNGARNVNMDDPECKSDRYQEVGSGEIDLPYAYDENDSKANSLKNTDFYKQNKQPGFLNKAFTPVWKAIEKEIECKQKRLWEYWNQTMNQFRFSLEYSEHFKSRGNISFINGSHGLESTVEKRMDTGRRQGYVWAKTTLHLPTKKDYEEFINFSPHMPSPEYVPITVVMHSQGNAKGIGVIQGIIDYVKNDLGWDRICINGVMLSVHQNLKLTGGEYKNFITKKKQMQAHDYILNWASSLFSETYDKLKKEKGINEYAGEFIEHTSWAVLKKHLVQFTYANDRGDLVMRMGDIPGIANAAHSPDNTDLFPFTIDDAGNTTLGKGCILENYRGDKDGVVDNYSKLLAIFAGAYAALQEQEAYYQANPDRRFVTYYDRGEVYTVDNLQRYIKRTRSAYGELFSAEIDVHGAPIAMGLRNGEYYNDGERKVINLIIEKGEPLYYRDLSHTNRIIKI